MNIKTLSLATGLVLALSGAAFAQGAANSGSGTPSTAGASNMASPGSSAMHKKEMKKGAMNNKDTTNSNAARGMNNDNGTAAGNPATSGSGTPNNAGATR